MSRRIFTGFAALLAVMLLTLFTATPVLAMDVRSGDTVTIVVGETVDDDLYKAVPPLLLMALLTVTSGLWAEKSPSMAQ